MDLRKINKLIDLLEESNLAEIEIKEGEESVRLARVPKGGGYMQASAPMVQHVAAPAHAAALEAELAGIAYARVGQVVGSTELVINRGAGELLRADIAALEGQGDGDDG